MYMKKIALFTALLALPLSMMAQDDDMYFVPTKANKTREAESYGMPKDTYYTGSDRSIDDYNRRSWQLQPVDSAGNDVIDFTATRGVYPDSVSQGGDYQLTRQMTRFDDYTPSQAYWDGYRDGTWASPWYYNSWYSWYDPVWYWDSPWYYGPRYGWYSSWYYGSYYRPWGYYGWYAPRYYYVGRPHYGGSSRITPTRHVVHNTRHVDNRGISPASHRSYDNNRRMIDGVGSSSSRGSGSFGGGSSRSSSSFGSSRGSGSFGGGTRSSGSFGGSSSRGSGSFGGGSRGSGSFGGGRTHR